jgi:hypothetical protein
VKGTTKFHVSVGTLAAKERSHKLLIDLGPAT